MATYKGKYTSNANGLYDLELYEDSTVKETATNIELDEVKSRIIVWGSTGWVFKTRYYFR